MWFRGVVYRAHDPHWSWTPLSGEGARRHGGRFNRRGVPALYTSLDPLTAMRKALGVNHSDLTCPAWETEMLARKIPSSQALADRLAAAGYAGMRVRSFATGTDAEDVNLVLWTWGVDRTSPCGLSPPCSTLMVEDIKAMGQERRMSHCTGTCRSNDVTLHYRHFRGPMPMAASHTQVFGAGATPTLIVHGLSYFSYDWIGIAAELCGDRDVAAMDMRGFGDSTCSPTGRYGLDDFAGDMRNLLDHLEWEKAVVMGHSMGGRNSTYFAAGHPDRVEKLVLVDYSPDNAPEGGRRVMNVVADTPDAFAGVDAALKYFGQDPHSPQDSSVRTRMANYLRPVDGGFAIKRDPVFREKFRKQRETGRREPLGANMWERLGAVRCPILVVRGRRSDMFAEETAPKVKKANANVTLVELDTGHNVGGEDPDGLVRAVEKFL